MKTVSITKIEHLPDITFGHSDATIRACYFILTRLALTKTGAIFTKWSKDDDFVAWKFSEYTALSSILLTELRKFCGFPIQVYFALCSHV